MEHSHFPKYEQVQGLCGSMNAINIITHAEIEEVHQDYREDFKTDKKCTVHNGKFRTHYLTLEAASKTTITEICYINVSKAVADEPEYFGCMSDFLASAYKFNRKSKLAELPNVILNKSIPKLAKVMKLVEAKNRASEWANGRGDIDGTPQYFEDIAQNLAKTHNLKLTVIKGQDLVTQGFRLMHAVGRASINAPTFINLNYNGNPDSKDYVAFIGKGVCFDSGGLNIKTAQGMKGMFLDKHGACSVLSAFQGAVEEKLKINLTCSIGMVENSINQNAYRQSDIIKSRKGLTVEIGNTDAEGRLVLADCMHWTQQNYKVSNMIELSTLTGAIISALGHQFAGLFTNDDELRKKLTKAGEIVHEKVWHMPVTNYHKNMITPKYCDITNSTLSVTAGSSQAAAFLKHFVQEGVNWIHLDIAGAAMVNNQGNGFGGRLLLQFARRFSHGKQE